MRVYSRPKKRDPRVSVWYVECYYWDRDRRVRKRRSTGVVDDGTVKSKRTAEIIGRDVAQSLALGKGRIARPTSIAQAVAQLVSAMERGQRAQPTIDIVIAKAARLYEFFDAGHPCAALTDQSLRDYADWARKTHAPGSVHRELRTLRQALKVAGFPAPPMPDLGRVYVPRETWLDHGQSLRLLAAVPVQWRDHVVMWRILGLRESELYAIDAPDIDWQRNEVRVRGTKTDGADRLIPMPPEVREILDRRKNRSPLFERWLNSDRDLPRAAVKAGLGRVTHNDLRRSFATELAAKGVPILHLAKLMGTGTRMLEQVYARVGQGDHMHAAMALLSPLRGGKAARRGRA